MFAWVGLSKAASHKDLTSPGGASPSDLPHLLSLCGVIQDVCCAADGKMAKFERSRGFTTDFQWVESLVLRALLTHQNEQNALPDMGNQT